MKELEDDKQLLVYPIIKGQLLIMYQRLGFEKNFGLWQIVILKKFKNFGRIFYNA